ncbi:mandelate racemase/muconate lactonizing enzyme family protein [Solitalea koreensis]|uniref:Dipeptide epimerase n=1 Tax=Solitalea koreensis TaxID=543615 RepID=A0A521AG58_9SPHI|nr:dipeptide epimerase [Solitalea koreensis]SMO33690.1 L-alanine-DL-glutamate epimerase [Solitalea koreensis]
MEIKITEIEIYKFGIAMPPFVISSGVIEKAQNTLIKIYTNQNIYGLGECSAFVMLVGETQNSDFELAKDFARIWKGKNPLEIERRMLELNTYAVHNPTIKSAFDMALHDIAAKYAQMPLYQFLGGRKKTIETDHTIGIDTPDIMAAQAVLLKSMKANIIKIKLGRGKDDVYRVKAVREAIGSSPTLRVDANQGWDFRTALYVLDRIAEYDIQLCEEPVKYWNNIDLKRITDRSPIPISADESVKDHHDAQRLAAMKACDYFNIKLAKSGGMRTAIKINGIAEAAGMKCMLGGMCESRIALSANAHFAMSLENIQFYDLDTALLLKEDPCIGGAQYNNYLIDVPDTPGIGADVDEAFLKTCERVGI